MDIMVCIGQYIDMHMETGRWGRTIYRVKIHPARPKYPAIGGLGLNVQL